MPKPIFITILLLIVSVCKTANGQVYNIHALDRAAQKIKVADNEKGTLIISCLKDTIYINNWNNTIESTHINRSFLKVVYEIHAGVGMHEAHTVVLCINHGRLIEALHITSLFHEEFMDFSEDADTIGKVAVNSTYSVNLSLTGNNPHDYKLNAKIHDDRKSKISHGESYSRDSESQLSFDPAANVFYTSKLELTRKYIITGADAENDIEQYIKGNFPVAKFGKITYYYIKGYWYERDDEDELVKYSCR